MRATVTVRDSQGNSSIREVDITIAEGHVLVGVVPPGTVIPAGEQWSIGGDLDLQGDLIVEGVLTGRGSFTVQCNGHQIEVRRGGRLDLAGNAKTGWVRVGTNSTGWESSDEILDTPGGWETVNLTRSIRIVNPSRILMHDGAGVQSLRWLSVEGAGRLGELGFYPVHFHMLGDASRGSVVEGVVVRDSNFRAFVPHGSHGVTFKDCVAYNIMAEAYWWDSAKPDGPGGEVYPEHISHDIVYDHCLAWNVDWDRDVLGAGGFHRNTAFYLHRGNGHVCRDCVAVGVNGGADASGFEWPENDQAVWVFEDCSAHHNNAHGAFVWQNTSAAHLIERFTAFNNKRDVKHGAYLNNYTYRELDVTTFELLALSRGSTLLIADSDIGTFIVGHHKLEGGEVEVRNCDIDEVRYQEANSKPSQVAFIDCALTPTDFTFNTINPASVIRIIEDGTVSHQWHNGSWS